MVNKESRAKFSHIKKIIETLTNFQLRPKYDPIIASVFGEFVIDIIDLERQFELYVRKIEEGESLQEAIEKEFGKKVVELIKELL